MCWRQVVWNGCSSPSSAPLHPDNWSPPTSSWPPRAAVTSDRKPWLRVGTRLSLKTVHSGRVPSGPAADRRRIPCVTTSVPCLKLHSRVTSDAANGANDNAVLIPKTDELYNLSLSLSLSLSLCVCVCLSVCVPVFVFLSVSSMRLHS